MVFRSVIAASFATMAWAAGAQAATLAQTGPALAGDLAEVAGEIGAAETLGFQLRLLMPAGLTLEGIFGDASAVYEAYDLDTAPASVIGFDLGGVAPIGDAGATLLVVTSGGVGANLFSLFFSAAAPGTYAVVFDGEETSAEPFPSGTITPFDGVFDVTFDPAPTVIPLPATAFLLIGGLGALAAARRRGA